MQGTCSRIVCSSAMSARDSSLTLENDMGGMGHRLAHFGGSEPPPYEGIACASRCSPLCVILSGATRSRTLRLAQGVPTARDLAQHKYGKARANASHLRILYCRWLPPYSVSLRLGHARALTTVQVVIHSPRAASLPGGSLIYPSPTDSRNGEGIRCLRAGR